MKQTWNGQKILVIGAARQGLALARFLSSRGAQVILNDQRPPSALQVEIDGLSALPVQWVLGGHPLTALDGVDLVCVSGGVPLTLPIILEAARRAIPITNDSQIFMQSVQAPVIGITGSAGKTTTTTLVGRMADHFARKTGHTAWIGGNIGLPLVEYVDQIQPDDLVIIEFSSFQLELMTTAPQVAAILNITPNHLDRHGTLAAYTAAKARLLDFQASSNCAILNRQDQGSWALRERVKGKLITFGLSRPPSGTPGTFVENNKIYYDDGHNRVELLPVRDIRLRGEHNLLNVLAAGAIACAAHFPVESIYAGVQGFGGVAHRLEWVRRWKGADWYNCSISTAPERVIADIQVFEEPIVLLLGGRDKNLPWDRLAELIHQRVDHVVVFGDAAEKIMQAISQHPAGMPPSGTASRLQTISRHAGLQEALQAAAQVVQPGDVVLLSPGATSYDQFKDFEERGERFREWVSALS